MRDSQNSCRGLRLLPSLHLRAALAVRIYCETGRKDRKILPRLQGLCGLEGIGGKAEREVVKMAVEIDKDKCTGCKACLEVCPLEALSMEDDKAKVEADTCTECGQCVDACPSQAISLP